MWLHHQLLPILLQYKKHFVDSLTLLRDVSKLQVPSHAIVFISDEEYLYPSIPTYEGVYALRTMIKSKFPAPKLELIMSLTSMVLNQHFLEFGGKFWRQKYGTAMGSNFAMVYACLFLCDLKNHVEESVAPHFDDHVLYF